MIKNKYFRKWYDKNRIPHIEKMKRYYRERREERLNYQYQYYEDHREERKKYQREYHNGFDPYKFREDVLQSQLLKENYGLKKKDKE